MRGLLLMSVQARIFFIIFIFFKNIVDKGEKTKLYPTHVQ